MLIFLTKRLDDLINGMVDTIKNHPIWKHEEMSNIKHGDKVEMNDQEGPLQLFTPEGTNKFLELCSDLKYDTLKILENIDQTDRVKVIKSRLKDATVWNNIFDLSILGIKEQIIQLEEKGDVEHGKE